MIKMYANDKPDDWHRGCGVVPDKDKNFCYECYLLTEAELEQLARDAFEAGENYVYHLHHSGSKSPSFAGFWEQKSLEIEK